MPSDQLDHTQWIRDALEEHERPLLSYAAKLFHGDVERARDAVQDTFLRLCKQPREKVDDHLAQWLFTVCRNRVFEVCRKEGRMKPLTDVDMAVKPASGPSPAADAIRHDRAARVAELIAELPERQQELLRLKFQNNLSYKQISSITELSVSNVGYLLHTGIQALRNRMRELEA